MRRQINKISGLLFVSIMILLFSQNLVAQNYKAVKDADLAAVEIKSASAGIQSLHSSFEQLKHLSFLEEDVVSKGSFFFKREKNVRWEYVEPYAYLIIIKGEQILIDNDGKKNTYNAGSNQLMKEINDIMVGIVTGDLLSSNKFVVSYFENETHYILKLLPQLDGMKSFINEIHLEINKTDFTVDQMKFLEQTDDFTLIRFKDKILNADIPDEIFSID